MKNSKGYQILSVELQEKYNSLFRETLLPDATDSEVRRKLEQMRATGYAMNLTDSLISTMKQEVEFRENEEPETETKD